MSSGSGRTAPAPSVALYEDRDSRESSAVRAAAAVSHLPWYPPTRTPWPGDEPHSSRTYARDVPSGASTTVEPLIVSMTVPGSVCRPTERNPGTPSRAATASWAYVSVLESRVGRPLRPRSLVRTFCPFGTAAPR